MSPMETKPRLPGRVFAAIGAVVMLTLLAFALHLRRERAHDEALRGTPIVPPKSATDFVLTATDGARAHLVDHTAATTFLFFGYTHCPDECPLALASLGRAYRSLGGADRRRTRVVFVSVDPVRDTPAVVRRYVAAFDPHIEGLTGSRGTLAQVWHAYGVHVDPASHEIAHGGSIYAIASGRVILEYPSDAPAGDLAADATMLANR